MKKLLFTSILGLSVVLAGCSELDTQVESEEAEAVEEVEVVEETEVVEEAEVVEETEAVDNVSVGGEYEATDDANRGAEELYLQILEENLGMYVSVEFDEVNKIFKLTPIDQGLIDEISMLPMGIGHEDWGILVDGLSSMSKSGQDLVGEGYTINLVNPLNHDNIILWIIDGEIMYNVVDEL